MSELIHFNDNSATIRWKLLTGASAMALVGYIASANLAKADDAGRPTLWIELGGQMEQMQGLYTPFTAPFMSAPTPQAGIYHGNSLFKLFADQPDVYQGDLPGAAQRPSRFAFGGEGKITFQPEDSDWVFSAGIRYGRSHSKRHTHHQTAGQTVAVYAIGGAVYLTYIYTNAEAFLDADAPSSEHHMVLDFSVGKDVGIGLLGRDGSSNINAGVRVFDLAESSRLTIYARPAVSITYKAPKYLLPRPKFDQYAMTAHAERSFRGIGPSLSWNASSAIAGNKQDGELMLDWGVNAALLFGRQKAKTAHSTTGTRFFSNHYVGALYPSRSAHDTRSRRITVPNIGGSVGLSLKWNNAKVSVGYRVDTFLKAMDTGIDARKTSNLTLNGPYASISIGLGD